MKTRRQPYQPSFLLRPRRWLNTVATAVFFAEMSLPAVCVAGGITADPNGGANRPAVDGSVNGVPVINIARPNDRGVSHNQYQDFNVPNQGAILNNSGKETSTQLAGWIQKTTTSTPTTPRASSSTKSPAPTSRGSTATSKSPAPAPT